MFQGTGNTGETAVGIKEVGDVALLIKEKAWEKFEDVTNGSFSKAVWVVLRNKKEMSNGN